MHRKIVFTLLINLFSLMVYAQDKAGKYFDLGIEVQQYPTGFLLGLRSEIGLAPHHALDLRVGYNLLDHQSFGVHENEEGGGFGFTIGYRYYFKTENLGWFLGVRSDLWFNKVEWQDNIDTPMAVNGTSDIIVFQPTAIAGYRFLINEKFVLTPTLAIGGEINIKTTGAEVGQGAIFLWGINVAYLF